MPKSIIEVENLSKLYRLGVIGATTIRESIERWWYRTRGKENELSRIGEQNFIVEPNDPQAGPEPNSIWALKDISFSVNKGEVIGIIGKNGAGKSTLLKILSRITEPTSGRAILRGRVASLLEVGTGFHPELTGRENIYLNGAILGMRKREINKKFDRIIGFAEIEKFIDTPVKRYSSGMYVRLAFAVAAHLEPEIMLVDEVLAVGDAAFQKKCLGKISDVAREGRTVLFVSHNMAAIAELTPRCLVLSLGKIKKSGPSSEIIEEYLSSRGVKSLNRDLNAVQRSEGGGRRWKITNVRINAPMGRITAGDSLVIELDYISYDNFEDVCVGVGISNVYGTRLISCSSEDCLLRLRSKTGDRGTVTVRIEKPYLSPGRYFLQLGAYTGTAHSLDNIREALEFEVGTNRNDLWGMRRPNNLGLRLPSSWESPNFRQTK